MSWPTLARLAVIILILAGIGAAISQGNEISVEVLESHI